MLAVRKPGVSSTPDDHDPIPSPAHARLDVRVDRPLDRPFGRVGETRVDETQARDARRRCPRVDDLGAIDDHPSHGQDVVERHGARTARRRKDPDGGDGALHTLLTAAVEETARLLDADGAMVYLMDPASGNLRFAHDAGIKRARTREWIRGLELAPGVGMFGLAVAKRATVMTSDYVNDA